MPSLLVMEYDDSECILSTCVLHNAVKHECYHHEGVNRIEIRLKTQKALLIDVASKVADATVAELTVHAAEKVIEFFVLTLVVSQITLFLNLGLVTCLSNPSRSC